jgi:hypothetical protein
MGTKLSCARASLLLQVSENSLGVRPGAPAVPGIDRENRSHDPTSAAGRTLEKITIVVTLSDLVWKTNRRNEPHTEGATREEN